MKSKDHYAVAALVGIATFLVFLPALRNQFVNLDDDAYIYDNGFIRSLDASFFKSAFLNFFASNWHPLTWVSHALDYAVWGLNPFGHHLTNNILHAANTAFVVVLLAELLVTYRRRVTREGPGSKFLSEKRMLLAGCLAGTLFGVHPLHVESVAWVSERKDLLCAFFFLLSLISYLRYTEELTHEKRFFSPFREKFYLLTTGFFVLSLLSKPMAVTLPAVLLILDWYPLGRITSVKTFRMLLAEKAPLIAISVASAVITLLAQHSGQSLISLQTLPLATRWIIGVTTPVAYLGKMLLPLGLVPFYPYPKNVFLLSLGHFLPVCLSAGILAVCVAVAKRQSFWLAVWGYYVITLLPVLGIIQVGRQSMADRYTYLPSIGPFLVLGLGAAWLWARVELMARLRLAARLLFIGSVSTLLIVLTFLTWKQIGVWRDSVTLWNYVIEEKPGEIPSAYNQRGGAYYERGQYDLAIADFNTAIAFEPETYFRAFSNRGMAYIKKGLTDRAIEDFDKAIAINPDYAEAFNNRGVSFSEKGLTDRAIEDFDKAIAINPDYAEAFNNRGVSFSEKGLTDRAIEDFNKAIAINPNFDKPYNNRGVAYDEKGLTDGAIGDFSKAIALNPRHYEAHRNLAAAYSAIGRYNEALDSYTGAIAVMPDNAKAYMDRAELFLKLGDNRRAVSDFRTACALGDVQSCATLQNFQKNN